MDQMIGIIAALIIGTLFLTTMMTTLFNIQINSRDLADTVPLHKSTEHLCNQLQSTLGMVGIGIHDGTAIITASSTEFKFRTMWSVFGDSLSTTADTVWVRQGSTVNQLGRDVLVTCHSQSLSDYRAVQWFKSMSFTYFDASGNVTTTLANIRSMRVDLSFEKPSSMAGRAPMKNKVSFWCYFKNLYLP
ncbi:MAG TPA: hypothetical protein PLE74_13360 [Candidatus Cloacimonadota bacterium]|nr:hypothetical protein [Candidatus Cloacimonadota bacterium]HPT73257.1 hypothetical protein [Candidatus Cloacimonadota bacterium]